MANQEVLQKVVDAIKYFLLEKNKRYGNSALEPLVIFTKHKNGNRAIDGILERLDDKLMRIKNADELKKNDVADQIGYLLLLCAAKGWDDFKDLLD
jgi:hypothetical protein